MEAVASTLKYRKSKIPRTYINNYSNNNNNCFNSNHSNPELINLENFLLSISQQNERIVKSKLEEYNIPLNEFDNENLETQVNTQVNSSRVSTDNERSFNNNNNTGSNTMIGQQEIVSIKAPKIDLKKNTLIFANRLKANICNNLFNGKKKEFKKADY